MQVDGGRTVCMAIAVRRTLLLVTERTLRGAVAFGRRGAFVAGFVLGMIGNALADPTVSSPGDLVGRLFDIHARPIAAVNWVLSLSLLALAVAPALLRAFRSESLQKQVCVRSSMQRVRGS